MEGEKERQRQQGEEKESNEADDGMRSDDDAADNDDEDSEGAALVWQEGYGEDNLGLPIMHWEALSLRIAELEKQEEEKKEKMAKSRASLERGRAPVSWTGERGRRRESWDDDDDDDNDDEACNSHMTALSSRLQTQMNLQLCFINDSESEEEDEEKEDDVSKKRGTIPVHKNPQPAAKPEKTKSRGFRNTWRKLRDRLRADHKPLKPATSDPIVQRRHLERSDLQNFTMKELNALCSSLRQTIQDLSTELVGRLQIRDQLRTEQDAMLLEVQDLTSLGTLLSSPS
ncbi:schwannomin-interacting protein 1 isoform X1 [Dunckerocampus dactyliophorus]|uniref:schwannomin-interacting protein 1 isoform X1 n=1 Tax=Dunckerocampus dactyliophorus TaxID=161453 RepID=UPI002405FA02|nr:schwannomin-interacting protein 1 isoform X1 [Dunckerocampus dactyliophorus]XP_054609122.1 schwannomin-interacting protein 1 isoform X1 [Dunckerocampus dactyliophorus]